MKFNLFINLPIYYYIVNKLFKNIFSKSSEDKRLDNFYFVSKLKKTLG